MRALDRRRHRHRRRTRQSDSIIRLVSGVLVAAVGLGILGDQCVLAEDVPLWGQFEVSISNPKQYTNPFTDVTLQASFTDPDGQTVPFPGFYDGNGEGEQNGNVWKIRFMPDKPGPWSYAYTWSDETASGSGRFRVVDAGLPGPIFPNDHNPKVWRTTGRGIFIPFYVAMYKYWEVDDARMSGFLDYVKNALGSNGVAINLVNRVWLDCENETNRQPRNLAFSIPNWKRLEKFLRELHKRELGANIMFYTDDEGEPGFAGRSEAETLLFRYAIARLAPYPLITFDSGIDITEYRSAAWSNWFAEHLASLDPWNHPVGSRHGGGSGNFVCDNCAYDSRGDVHPDYSEIFALMMTTTKPVFYTDRWREDFFRGQFDSDSIRAILWHCALSGGAGFMIGGRHGDLRLEDYETDLDNPAQFHTFSQFWHERVRSWDTFAVCGDAVSNGLCFGKPGTEYVIYLEQGGTTTVDLSRVSGQLGVAWLNPRTGEYRVGAAVAGSPGVVFAAPDTKDWILHIGGFPLDETPPTAPAALRATASGESQIDLTWTAARDSDTEVLGYRIYRDGVLADTVQSTQTRYTDTHRQERTSYRYDVSALNGTGVEGPRSDAISVTTLPDTTPPGIVSVRAAGDRRRVTVIFDEPVTKDAAEAAHNYTIEPGVSVSDAIFQPDGVTVSLTTSELLPNIEYLLTATNIRDRAVAGNIAAHGVRAPFLLVTRVREALVALYDFAEREGSIVHDVSGVGEPLHLAFADEDAVEWIPGGLEIKRHTLIASNDPARKINEACIVADELTIEAWIRPANTTQNGPARIVTVSVNPSARNLTLGQDALRYEVRLRTTATTNNGIPSLSTRSQKVSTRRTHIVYTRDASGKARIYQDGLERATGQVRGDLSNWDTSLRLGLANEPTGDRGWLGAFYLVAIYSRALSDAEVTQNFECGCIPGDAGL